MLIIIIMLIQYVNILLLSIASVLLIVFHLKLAGWMLWGTGLFLLLLCTRKFRKYFFLLYLSFAILAVAPITTDTRIFHMAQMGILLTSILAFSYFIPLYFYKDFSAKNRLYSHAGKRFKVWYLPLIALLAYITLPFFLKNTSSYQYWPISGGASNLLRLFIGINLLGIWEELFFINTVLRTLLRFFSFPFANIIQSILFTSFLYELGFRGWGFLMVLFFSFMQGYVFQRTQSLRYIIIIHLTVDFILYLALIHAYQPAWIPLFLT